MNYISLLKRQNGAYQDGLNHLKNYLLSDKFYTDTTVQIRDVLSRIAEIEEDIKNIN